jgi:hypothetical protein
VGCGVPAGQIRTLAETYADLASIKLRTGQAVSTLLGPGLRIPMISGGRSEAKSATDSD